MHVCCYKNKQTVPVIYVNDFFFRFNLGNQARMSFCLLVFGCNQKQIKLNLTGKNYIVFYLNKNRNVTSEYESEHKKIKETLIFFMFLESRTWALAWNFVLLKN